MNAMLRIGFAALARPTFDIELAAELACAARRSLESAHLELYGSDQLILDQAAAAAAAADLAAHDLDLLLILQATFADSGMALELARRVAAPLLLWALPEAPTGGRLRLNSLCGVNLAAHALTRAARRYQYLYAPPADPRLLPRIDALARAGRARRLLRQARIARVGERPAGFETCDFDADALAQRFGLEVIPLELADVFAAVRATPPETIAPLRRRLAADVAGLDSLDQNALAGTLGVYASLRRLADERRLHGMAVRCWPEFFTDLGCAACGAMALLTDERIPCSCEADVNGAVTQLLLQAIGDGPAFGADLVSLDADADTAVFWHCGLAPPAMADPAFPLRATIHSNRRLPLLLEFPLKPGRVTLARLSQAGGAYRLVVGGGDMLAAPPPFAGTAGVLRFDRPAGAVLDTIMHAGLEHHYTLIYGDYRAALLAFADLFDLPTLDLTEG